MVKQWAVFTFMCEVLYINDKRCRLRLSLDPEKLERSPEHQQLYIKNVNLYIVCNSHSIWVKRRSKMYNFYPHPALWLHIPKGVILSFNVCFILSMSHGCCEEMSVPTEQLNPLASLKQILWDSIIEWVLFISVKWDCHYN